MSDAIRSEIEREIAENTILVYGKGTKDAPQCGFTLETIQFFNHFGYPFEVVNVLENMPKRARARRDDRLADAAEGLHRRTVLRRHRHPGPMAENGELKTLLEKTFAGKGVQPTIQLR